MKVELEQLIISILDDPSVSRVMREASFSSPAVKAAIEQASGPTPVVNQSGVGYGYGFRPGNPPVNRNIYINPRLQQYGAVQIHKPDDFRRVLDILLRPNKRNPILVGESESKILAKQILGKIENGELPDSPITNSQVVRVENTPDSGIAARIGEISQSIETRMKNSDLGGVILDLGDLKWLVDNRGGSAAAEAVAEMRKLLERFGTRLWLIGTATCETYLRCQVYFPSMENDWGLQAVLVAAQTQTPPTWLVSNNGSLLRNPVEPISPMRIFPTTNAVLQSRNAVDGLDSSRRMSCCPECTQNYKTDLANLQKSNPEAAAGPRLPQWLQNAKSGDGDAITAEKTCQMNNQELLELEKKWNETCLRLHRSYHQPQNLIGGRKIVPSPVPLPSVYGIVPNPRFNLQTDKNSGGTLFLNAKSDGSPPASPVRTDLVLGRPKKADSTAEKPLDKIGIGDSLDIETFKRLLKGLTKNVWWQHDAASAVAATVSQCRLGNGKRRGVSSKNDVWLLFVGPDKVGKKKMASALSDLICGSTPTTINLGSRRDEENTDVGFRGKTVLDRIVESVKKNPFSVIVLEEIDGADMLLRGSLKRAMERGRICDSHGREISLGNVVFILTADWSTESEHDLLPESFVPVDEDRLLRLVSGGWQLRIAFSEKTSKRIPSWLCTNGEERSVRPRKETSTGLTFDLNETANADNDKAIHLSGNSSDLTLDHDQDDSGSIKTWSEVVPSAFRELLRYIDDSVYFRPVDFGLVKRNTEESLKNRLSNTINGRLKVEIKDDALERIAAGVWLGRTGIEEWIEKVFVPNLNQMKSRLTCNQDENVTVRMELDEDSDGRSSGEFLPTRIKIITSQQE